MGNRTQVLNRTGGTKPPSTGSVCGCRTWQWVLHATGTSTAVGAKDRSYLWQCLWLVLGQGGGHVVKLGGQGQVQDGQVRSKQKRT